MRDNMETKTSVALALGQAQEAKHELEAAIAALVQEYTDRTGLAIESIDVDTMHLVDGFDRLVGARYRIEVEVKL